jgi:glycine betaine monooxygenase A
MNAVSEIAGPRAYYTSLPREYFVSEEIFETEMNRVITRQWLYVGHVSQVRQPGDYFVRQVGPESMIITRDDSGEVRAFFNVCRHRGAELCPRGSSGQQKRFVCPYHQWSFATSGKLIAVPGSSNGVDFDFADFPLHQAHCQVYTGLIFVNLSPEREVQPLSEVIVPSDAAAFERVAPQRVKVAYEKLYPVKANWKVVLENNLECYHCPVGHPEMQVVVDSTKWFIDRAQLAGGEVWNVGDVGAFPFRAGVQTFSLDGKWVSKKPLGTGFEERFSAGIGVNPVTLAMAFYADHGAALQVFPVSKDTTLNLAQWFVHEDAVEGVDYEIDRLIAIHDTNNQQDATLAELQYRGVVSRRYTPGPHIPTRENGLMQTLELYRDLMGLPSGLPR